MIILQNPKDYTEVNAGIDSVRYQHPMWKQFGTNDKKEQKKNTENLARKTNL